jgi:hypothetical protein
MERSEELLGLMCKQWLEKRCGCDHSRFQFGADQIARDKVVSCRCADCENACTVALFVNE